MPSPAVRHADTPAHPALRDHRRHRARARRGNDPPLTGETGAGKSILLDALGQVLGERASPLRRSAGSRACRDRGELPPRRPARGASLACPARARHRRGGGLRAAPHARRERQVARDGQRHAGVAAHARRARRAARRHPRPECPPAARAPGRAAPARSTTGARRARAPRAHSWARCARRTPPSPRPNSASATRSMRRTRGLQRGRSAALPAARVRRARHRCAAHRDDRVRAPLAGERRAPACARQRGAGPRSREGGGRRARAGAETARRAGGPSTSACARRTT